MKYIYTLIFIALSSNLFAENPPKVTTQQFENWTYQCIESEKNKNCEVNQNIRIQNSNINFSIVYTKFLNTEKNSKRQITIIAPLGIDLSTQLALRFDGKDQINLSWSSCEQIGCLVFLSNNTKDEKSLELYKKIYNLLSKSNTLEIAVKGYTNKEPVVIQSNLNGFNSASKKLDS
tara:strand:- start:105 stop:632 length:528 start_codon:yes stop_codon:yes gene_type:complete